MTPIDRCWPSPGARTRLSAGAAGRRARAWVVILAVHPDVALIPLAISLISDPV